MLFLMHGKRNEMRLHYKKTILFCVTLLLCIFAACKKEEPVSAALPETVTAMPITETATPTAPTVKAEEISLSANTPQPVVQEAQPVPTATPTPTATPRLSNGEKYWAPDGVYTVAWVTDTQHYANTFPEIYPTITEFLYNHRDDLNLVYVIHTGDLTHKNRDTKNWERAVEAMDILGDIPYGVLAGNHDMAATLGYENYWKYFGEDKFKSLDCYGASFENNRGHYDLLTIGDTDYIFVYMSHEPNEAAMQFMKDSFDAYPDRVGILCLHEFMTTEGTISKTGKIIREKVVSACPNCYLVLCGHRYGVYCLTDTFDDDGDGEEDRTVYEMMCNYQSAGKEGGSGYFRLMRFNDASGEIEMMSYSPYLQDYNLLDDPSKREERYRMDETSEEFTLKMPWKR